MLPLQYHTGWFGLPLSNVKDVKDVAWLDATPCEAKIVAEQTNAALQHAAAEPHRWCAAERREGLGTVDLLHH